ncbi:MAG: hypothetical protein ABSF91_14400 [Bacteroidota bacterium]|jgi:hypothetical protein
MRSVLAIVILTLSTHNLHTQPAVQDQPDSLRAYFQFEESSPFSCLAEYFPPLFIEHGIELKSFIRSTTFKKLRQRFGDARSVDAIYVRSMSLTNNNTALALLLASLATFDHRVIGLKVPLLRILLPLSDESEEDFSRRVNSLPSRLYQDTPHDASGDRDKLQHFFGSAFLAFITESRNPAERFGTFIEEGEDLFIVGGVNDERDMRANHQGQEFGLAVLNNNHHFPSEYLRIEVANKATAGACRALPDEPFCSGDW